MITVAPPLTIPELEQSLRAANPGVVLLPPRRLRRVIKEDRDIGGLGLQVPHGRAYTIGRERLLQLVPRDELGLDAGRHLPATVLLLVRPSSEELAASPRGEVLRQYWSLLFHTRIHAVLERRLAAGQLGPAAIAERVDRIGCPAWNEIRWVLGQDRRLLPPADDVIVYIEFAALYLELRAFEPHLPPVYFPSIEDFASIDGLLAQDAETALILAETRLAGALELASSSLPPCGEGWGWGVKASPPTLSHKEGGRKAGLPPKGGGNENGSEDRTCCEQADTSPPPSEDECRWLRARAERAERIGNVVRAARLRMRAARRDGQDQRDAAGADLDRLTERLGAALGSDAATKSEWREVLEPLLEPASRGIWPVEARLLYDLQKVCIDRERAVYAVDVVEWVYSLGRRPIQRLLPGQAEVLQLKHLRSAARRAASARIALPERRELETVLHGAIARAEKAVRETFRPRTAEVLDDVGMRPANLPEQVALNKLTEELLDRVVERGYLNMGHLRDAVSRNNLRLPDLSGPREFFRGDRLIRANRRLPVLLDGVYRRGEFYLRWLQRLSSVAFGTVVGRILVLYLLLPFGGSFVALEGVQHILNPIAELFAAGEPSDLAATPSPGREEAPQEPDEEESDEDGIVFEKPKAERFHLATPMATIVLGCFLLGLLHSAAFRGWVVQALRWVGRGLHVLFLDLPALLLRLAAVRWLLSSWPVILFARYIGRPALIGLFVGILGRSLGLTPRESFVAGAASFLAGCFFFNSRLAAELEEAVTDWLVRVWHRFSLELIPALFHFIMAVFKRLIEGLDRVLYTVDEWLRFRQGESRWTFTWKLVLGMAWFLISYIIRAYVNLFFEPQTNPIKHFPVVTVSAKLLLPLAPTLVGLQLPLLSALPPGLAKTIAVSNVFLLPGIFGFLAWELKENWRLYRANQPRTLRPDAIGHHGETMRRFLKPGFHSGTVPKLYRKLRHAAWAHDSVATRKYRETILGIEEAVRHFAERELVYLLDLSRSWGKAVLSPGRVVLGCTNIRVELRCPQRGADSVWILFEEQAGLLSASIADAGWLERLEEVPARAFEAAVTGWYKLAAVERVCGYPAFSATPITWRRWLDTWQRDQRGEELPDLPKGLSDRPASHDGSLVRLRGHSDGP